MYIFVLFNNLYKEVKRTTTQMMTLLISIEQFLITGKSHIIGAKSSHQNVTNVITAILLKNRSPGIKHHSFAHLFFCVYT
jgi:hypothetical protein